MSHGEKLLLVAFIITMTGDASSDVNNAIRMIVGCVLGVVFANWQQPKQGEE